MDSISSSLRRKAGQWVAGSYQYAGNEEDCSRQHSTELHINSGITRPRLLNKQHQGKAIDRFGVSWEKAVLYWGDLFHTLLNMPRYRFIVIFFSIYVMEYLFFALLYLSQPNHCVPHVKHWRVALWFSVQTAATIGYGAPLAPNPECTAVNLMVMFQVITSSLIDYCCMGLVFARFSAPSQRASSLRFSNCLVLAPDAKSGYWALGVRVANMRKHIMIRPEVQILLAKPDNPGQSAFECQLLPLEDPISTMANIRLGMAVTMVHVIRPGSPLWELSVDDLLLQEMEVMVLFEGIDAMTSNSVQARHSYYPTDMLMNERFATLYMMYKGQRLGLDLTEFDATVKLGAPETGAFMRRQKFCNLTAAAKQQLEQEAPAAQHVPGTTLQRQQQQQNFYANGQIQPANLEGPAGEVLYPVGTNGSPKLSRMGKRHSASSNDIEMTHTSHEL